VSRVVWKYQIRSTASAVTHAVPRGGRILHAELQHDDVCVWIEVDDEHPREDWTFRLFVTGQPLPINAAYVRTILLADGDLVLHLYRLYGADELRQRPQG